MTGKFRHSFQNLVSMFTHDTEQKYRSTNVHTFTNWIFQADFVKNRLQWHVLSLCGCNRKTTTFYLEVYSVAIYLIM